MWMLESVRIAINEHSNQLFQCQRGHIVGIGSLMAVVAHPADSLFCIHQSGSQTHDIM